MFLEADLIAKRATLHWLAQRHPHWTHHELAAALGMSRRLCEQVAPATAPGRSPRCHGPALPLACAAYATNFHRLTACGRATHPGDPPGAPRELATRPGARSDPVLLAPRFRTASRRRAPAALADADLEDLTERWLYCPGSSSQAQAVFRPGNRVRKSSSTSKMPAVFPPIRKASGNRWWRLPTSSTLAPRSGCTERCVAILMPKRCWKR